MSYEVIPVTLVELKKHLRISTDLLDDQLISILMTAIERVEQYTLVRFDSDYTDTAVPFALRQAILLIAEYYFDPTHAKSEQAAINLLQSCKQWNRVNG